MKVLDILLFLGDLGARFPKTKLWLVERYFSHMIADGRVVTIYKDGKPHGLMAFSLCNDYEPFWKKQTWDYVPHDPSGKTLYLEFMAASYWDKKVRKKFQQAILDKYPNIESAVWHKWARWGDRKVCWRRRCHVSD